MTVTKKAWVFAVEDTALQVCWRGFGPGEHTVVAGPAVATSRGELGAADLVGLDPDTIYDVTVDGRSAGRVRTLAPPPGRELCRIATVNDVHIGEPAFGVIKLIREKDAEVPYPQRCLRAALDEAIAWGAQHVVVKGDLTNKGLEEEFEVVADELGRLAVPVTVVLGNHDVSGPAADGAEILHAAGVPVSTEPEAVDVPGLRLVVSPTARVGDGHGHMSDDTLGAIIDLVRAVDTPVMVAVHHYPQRWPLPTVYPPGIPGGQARALLNAIALARPDAVFVSGHSHRHRMHRRGAMPVAEIGSTKDYPGAWAGYVVYEGGIRQVVRRVAEPSAFAWTDRTRHALFGIWSLWSPGLRTHRCWSHRWLIRD